MYFGLGRKYPKPVDHELFDDPTWREIPQVGALKDLARAQLGTVGSGNHFVDLFVEPATDDLWVGVHFGSRGLGHKTATGFLNLAQNMPWGATPLAPGQLGFIGGSMADMSAIVRGRETEEAKASLYSTVHGAGRVMSRTEAAGKRRWKTGEIIGATSLGSAR